MENLQTKESFLHYVRSATNSVIEAAKRKRELWVIHETLSAEQDAEDARQRPTIKALPAADEDTAMLDLKTELFVRLRQVAPRRLLPTINDWETTFLWDSILPYRKKRVYRDQVRRLAIRILRQIAEDFRDDTPKHW